MENFKQDPYIPAFKYTNAERETMLNNGLTDEEIDAKERLANKKIAGDEDYGGIKSIDMTPEEAADIIREFDQTPRDEEAA